MKISGKSSISPIFADHSIMEIWLPTFTSNSLPKDTNPQSFHSRQRFSCTGKITEGYKCNICYFKTHLMVDLKQHKCLVKPTKIPKNLSCYCGFETFSQLIFMKHIYTSCKSNESAFCISYTESHFKFIARYNSKSQMCRDKYTSPENIIWIRRGKLLIKAVNKSQVDKALLAKPASLNCHNVNVKPEVKPQLKRYVCEECPFKSKNPSGLKRHYLLQHGAPENIKWFECEQCLYKSKWKTGLTKHIKRIHVSSEDVWLACEECPYKTKDKYYLQRHVKRIHAIDDEDLIWSFCNKCDYKTKWIQHLRRHKKEQHMDPENFTWYYCDQCLYKAKQKIHLKLHVIQKHIPAQDIEWYECQHCSYKAKLKASLKNHVLRKHKNK